MRLIYYDFNYTREYFLIFFKKSLDKISFLYYICHFLEINIKSI